MGNQTKVKYGNLPKSLGVVDLSPEEMMFWLYCPIKFPYEIGETWPKNLNWVNDLLDQVANDLIRNHRDLYLTSYIYLTVKTLYVTPENMGNRPGWHSDGFGTDDLNYIWCDKFPTEFMKPPVRSTLPEGHKESMEFMNHMSDYSDIVTYEDKTLLKLDQTVLHRVPVIKSSGVRSFVKISVSKDKYNLKGNSINPDIDYDWTYYDRLPERNHPQVT